MLFTVDSSIIVAALRRQERWHEACLRLLERIGSGEHLAVAPYTVLVEVSAAIRRRTGSVDLANRVAQDLQSLGPFEFVELDAQRARAAVDLAAALGLRGMDAVVVQVAQEFEAPLVSLDEELVEKARSTVKVVGVEALS